MNSKLTNLLYLAAVSLTIIALLSYPLIPKRELFLLPNSAFPTFSLVDKETNGNSQAKWLKPDHSMWYCNMKKGAKIPSCNFGQYFNNDISQWHIGLNLSQYQTINFDVNYQGPANYIRIYLRSFDPAVSDINEFNSAQFITTTIRKVDFNKPLVYDFNELHLADWWVSEFDVPKHHARINLNHVTELGIDFDEKSPLGEHTFQINNISLSGDYIEKEHWYLGILSLWLTGIVLRVVYQLNKLYKRNKQEKIRLAEMTNYAQELKQKSDTYKNLSITDALTQTLNRYGLQNHLQILLENSATTQIGLIILDIDFFKRINDKWGHNIGDEVLCSVGLLLNNSTRQTDLVARWGGEEFVILCPNTESPALFSLAEKLRIEITQLEFLQDFSVTASFGMSMMQPTEQFESSFKAADEALYKAKNKGRNCCVVTPNFFNKYG
ncbi:GGDEF domain-containing protein [Paraglaciecola aquimarina]|uniref:diguanylate cyclase n=1 Tax=Paraglaciecola algarum TaxID=3050085 RepID=A0ABS9D713_9ALTE|nr:GGDEF domain-containing protein [Paraglaciecola sp. G1-23]MCF2948195.1 GGDEF domain-containing protein [Paraglaciecola sp. G1-23]